MRIQEITYEGLKAVELTTSKIRLVAVSEFGPRIAFFGPLDGDNLLLWKPGKYTRKEWDLRGGHRVWVTRPGADEAEDTYAVDNGPCEVEILENGFVLTGQKNESNEIRRGFRITVLADDQLEVDNFLINDSSLLYSGGVWGLTCTVPNETTQYGIPVGNTTSWNTFTMVFFKNWAGQGEGGFDDDQIQVKNDFVRITPKGVENKRMLLSERGIIAMSDPKRDLTFAKKVDYDPALQYPLGTNMAFYIGPKNFMVEMETMGPETTIRPGDSWHSAETWVLKPGAVEFDAPETVEALFE